MTSKLRSNRLLVGALALAALLVATAAPLVAQAPITGLVSTTRRSRRRAASTSSTPPSR
ncbi:MAG: hypothetical protein R2862_08925 [Thermoanaerobaculia bacterium]